MTAIPIGARFGRLTVIEHLHYKNGKPRSACVCRCDCGQRKAMEHNTLLRGFAVSCGCIHPRKGIGAAMKRKPAPPPDTASDAARMLAKALGVG